MLKVSSKLNLDDVHDEVGLLIDIIKDYGCGRIAVPVTRYDEILPGLFLGDWFVFNIFVICCLINDTDTLDNEYL